jgi:Domain of unknown function (DUF4189)
MKRNGFLIGGLAAGCLILSAGPVAADGAVAIGVPKNVVKEGVAQGYSIRAKTREDARKVAMAYCTDVKKSSKAAVALCKVVQDFHDQCVAFALDPEPGTPGYGWGLGPDKAGAEKVALTMCYGNAGANRHDFCKAMASDCDGTANK